VMSGRTSMNLTKNSDDNLNEHSDTILKMKTAQGKFTYMCLFLTNKREIKLEEGGE